MNLQACFYTPKNPKKTKNTKVIINANNHKTINSTGIEWEN